MPKIDMTEYSDVAFVKELRELAGNHYDLDIKVELNSLADNLSMLIKHFTAIPSQRNLMYLNGNWAHAKVLYDSIVLNGNNGPRGGSGEVQVSEQTSAIARAA